MPTPAFRAWLRQADDEHTLALFGWGAAGFDCLMDHYASLEADDPRDDEQVLRDFAAWYGDDVLLAALARVFVVDAPAYGERYVADRLRGATVFLDLAIERLAASGLAATDDGAAMLEWMRELAEAHRRVVAGEGDDGDDSAPDAGPADPNPEPWPADAAGPGGSMDELLALARAADDGDAAAEAALQAMVARVAGRVRPERGDVGDAFLRSLDRWIDERADLPRPRLAPLFAQAAGVDALLAHPVGKSMIDLESAAEGVGWMLQLFQRPGASADDGAADAEAASIDASLLAFAARSGQDPIDLQSIEDDRRAFGERFGEPALVAAEAAWMARALRISSLSPDSTEFLPTAVARLARVAPREAARLQAYLDEFRRLIDEPDAHDEDDVEASERRAAERQWLIDSLGVQAAEQLSQVASPEALRGRGPIPSASERDRRQRDLMLAAGRGYQA